MQKIYSSIPRLLWKCPGSPASRNALMLGSLDLNRRIHNSATLKFELKEPKFEALETKSTSFKKLKMAPITIWQMPPSPPSWTVRMMADTLGLELQVKDIDFLKKEHKSPEFRKLNPMGTVPTIQDGDFVISESHTIMKYLLQKYGQEHQQLYPSDIRARAQVDQAMYFDTGVAFIRVKIIALPAIFGDDTGLTREAVKSVEEAYEVVEDFLSRHSFVATDEFTIADLSLGSTMTALDAIYEVDSKKYPKTCSWLCKLLEMRCFQNIARPGAVVLRDAVKASWEANKVKCSKK